MHLRYSSILIIAVLVLASLFPLITAIRYPAFLNDDSFITLTYAKNLADGHGFLFNHPPAVLGTTTPLFTLIVAGIASVFHQVPIDRIAVFLTALCWLGIVWLIFFFHKVWGLEEWQAGIVGLVVIGSGWIGYLGMEAYLFAFLLVLCVSLFFSRNYFSTGLISGLLFLTRGEGIIILGIIFIIELIQQLRKNKSFDKQFVIILISLAIGFAIPVLPWIIYAHSTFGSILPNTLAAKQAQDQTGLWSPFWKRLVNQWIPTWGQPFIVAGLPLFNLWWVIILIGIVTALFQRARWLLFVGWIILYILGYVLIKVSAYWWYELPILFVLNLFFSLGIIKVIEILRKHIKSPILFLSFSILIIGLIIFLLAMPTIKGMLAYQGDPRGKSYSALSQWFRENTDNSKSIAYIEIGYLGFYTNNRIIDLAGLTTPDVLPHIAMKDFAWGFWHYHPDYYAFLPDFDWALASIRADPRFDQQYQPVTSLPGPGKTDFIIYKRISK